MPRKVILFSDILAMNLLVGWMLLACLIKWSTSVLSLSAREKIASIYLCPILGLVQLTNQPFSIFSFFSRTARKFSCSFHEKLQCSLFMSEVSDGVGEVDGVSILLMSVNATWLTEIEL